MSKYNVVLFVALLTVACSTPDFDSATVVTDSLRIYPDYNGVTVPVNIAPLNFRINEDGDNFASVFEYGDGKSFLVNGNPVVIPYKRWRNMIRTSVGGSYTVTVYVRNGRVWRKYPTLVNNVSCDEIDGYLSYRLIEPGYSNYGRLCIRQRDLSCFDEWDVYNNYIMSRRVEQQCINCHSFQNYHTERMQFHVRQLSGGTVIKDGDNIRKVNLKRSEEIISNGVYPSWHPIEPLVAYSVNTTNQVFLRNDRQRLEVYDSASDLVLYDVNTDEVSLILCDTTKLETFPAWSQDGGTLYYASADLTRLGLKSSPDIFNDYERIRYSVYSLSFDAASKRFGEPCLVYDAEADSLSAVTPRPSPDGKFILSAVGGYGCFHIWHDDGDLYLTNLETFETRPLSEVNSSRAESFHAWSSNSRWIVFATRRDDRTCSRLYISYFDRNGTAHKPFLLPQKNPDYNIVLMKSYNVPEFTVEKVGVSPKRFRMAIEEETI